MKLIKVFFFLFISLSLFAELKFGDIEFSGNALISDEELYRTINAHKGGIFSNKTINEDISNIIKLYESKGFYNVIVYYPKVITTSPENIKVIYHIEESSRFIVSDIEFTGNKYISNKLLKEKIGNNFYFSELNSKIEDLLEFFNNNGYFFAEIVLKHVSKTDKNHIKIELKIDEGDYCEFKKFVFKGNKISSNKSLLRISGLNKAKRITPNILEQAKENLLKQSYIKDCEIIPLNSNEILISVQEGKMNYFSGIAGYNSKEKKKDRINGFVNFSFLNIAGEGRAVSFVWKNIPSKIKMVKISYEHPFVYNYPIGINLEFERTEKTYIKTQTSLEIYYKSFNYKYGTSLSYENYYSNDKENYFERQRIIKPGFIGEINTTDSFYNPIRGYIFKFHYYLILKSQQQNQAIESELAKFLPLRGNLVFYFKMASKIMENKNLSYYEYFHLGGLNSLRGFLEESFYGYDILWSNLEIRLLSGNYSSFFFFTDWGYVKNLDYTNGKLFGFGLGFRLGTKLGVFEFDYGLGYQNGELTSPMNGIVHFGISSGL